MTANTDDRRMPLLMWPFWLVWKLVSFVVGSIGLLVGFVLALLLMVIGLLLTGTLIGAVIGIPMFLVGALLLVRVIL